MDVCMEYSLPTKYTNKIKEFHIKLDYDFNNYDEKTPKKTVVADETFDTEWITPAYADRFLLYLQEKNYLSGDLDISRKEAKRIFNEEFRKSYPNKSTFYFLVLHLKSYLTPQKDRSKLRFKRGKLQGLVAKKEEIDKKVENLKDAKKHVLVSQAKAFKRDDSKPIMVKGTQCNLCDEKGISDMEAHLKSPDHVFREYFSLHLQSPQKGSAWEKFSVLGGSSADGSSKGSNQIATTLNEPKVVTLQAKASHRAYTITNVQWRRKNVDEVTFHPGFPRTVKRNKSVHFEMGFVSAKKGVVYFPILFTIRFLDDERRELHLPVEIYFHTHSSDLNELHAKEPTKSHTKSSVTEFITETVACERPSLPKTGQEVKCPLKQYPLTNDLVSLLNAGLNLPESPSENQRKLRDKFKNVLDLRGQENGINRGNLTEVLEVGLFLEEHQMRKDIRNYDRSDQLLQRVANSRLLRLKIDNLAENRPSIMPGDTIYVRQSPDSQVQFQGYVQAAENESVLLNFSNRFHSVYQPQMRFYVVFTCNRYPFRVQHQAVEITRRHNLSRFFFPTAIVERPLENFDIDWINDQIRSNPEQQQAVREILAKSSRPHPYPIFGPPGTGKTMTMVEAIMQIHRLMPEQHVLVCAPSNSACNVIASRLASTITEPNGLLRYVAQSQCSNIPDDLRRCSNVTHRGEYFHPSKTQMYKYRIVICTLVHSARLLKMGVHPEHFNYVFVDESSQATIAETLIPIAGIVTEKEKIHAQIVLGGDPKQLGSVQYSDLCKQLQLDKSLLEHLEKNPVYQENSETKKLNSCAATQLRQNYRSNAHILEPFNILFYNNKLLACGGEICNSALGWAHLPNPAYPIIFHSVNGIDQTERDGCSFFNVEEIDVVMDYVEKLIGKRLGKSDVVVRQEDIAIISPYRKQVLKIQQLCRKKGYAKLTVGSVEQMQGQERLITIQTTVRSRPEFQKFDFKYSLGFLKNPKRMNVSITRAKALIIHVGNPNILQHDKYWRQLIAICQQNGAMAGEPFEFSTDLIELENGNVEEEMNGNDKGASLSGASFEGWPSPTS